MTARRPHPPLALPAWLAWAQDAHADAQQEVLDGLLQRAAELPADADGAAALQLAEHVWLAHRGDGAGLADFLARLAWDDAGQAEAGARLARSRIAWALAALPALAGQPAPALPDAALPDVALPDAARWRALQNLVLALAQQRRCGQAEALLLADEAAAAACGSSEAGRAFAACANNVAQHLSDGRRGAADLDHLMLVAAHLAQRAWLHAGSWLQQERAEYRLALCQALLGAGPAALVHARRCLAACLAGDGKQPADALEHFFAHEALARAHHAAGDALSASAAAGQMARLLADIDAADVLLDWCRRVLQALPA